MRTEQGLPKASWIDGMPPIDSLTLVFDTEPPAFGDSDFLEGGRRFYRAAAIRAVDALLDHAPGGFIDAFLGELFLRKSSVLRIPDPASRETGR